jgi:predicted outer membrane repeat protein
MYFNKSSSLSGLLVLVLATAHQVIADEDQPQGCAGDFGLNGSQCCFTTIQSAIAAANPNDIIYIRDDNQTFTEFIGTIDKNLTIQSAQAGEPNFSGCEVYKPDSNIVFDVNWNSYASQGGLLQVTNNARVNIWNITMQRASADYGGLIAVLGGSELRLYNVTLSNGIANQQGGNVYIEGTAQDPGKLYVSGSDLIYGAATFDGGAVAMVNTDGEFHNTSFGTTESNFNIAGRNGGALYSSDSLLELVGGSMRYNTAGKKGGAVYQNNGTATTLIGYYWGNKAYGTAADDGGGAFYLHGDASIEMDSSQVYENDARLGGGMMAVDSSQISLIDSARVRDNTAINGAGIYSRSTVLADDSIIKDNQAEQSGGGIYCDQCALISLNNISELSGNLAHNGGGIYFDGLNSQSLLEVNGSLVSGNTATGEEPAEGGGIYLNQGRLHSNQTEYSGNSAVHAGGAVASPDSRTGVVSEININQSLFDLNTTTDFHNFGPGGSVMNLKDIPDIQIHNSLFSNNVTEASGTLRILNSTLLLHHSIFQDNLHDSSGTLYFTSTDFDIDNNTFIGNQGSTGGALRISSGTGRVSNSQFISNSANQGGALYLSTCNQQQVFTLTNNQFINNAATIDGGAIDISSCDVDIFASTGTDPSIHCNPLNLAFGQACNSFINNQAAFGGAINMDSFNRTLNIDQALFSGNTATETGAAVYVTGSSGSNTVNLSNLLVHSNGSLVDDNTVIDSTAGHELNLYASTLAENQGIPLRVDGVGSQANLYNNIIQFNSLGPHLGVLVSVDTDCNNAQGVAPGSQPAGINLGDPLFITDSRSDYALQPGSPSLDACLQGPSHDLDGKTRPGGGMHDQGAFEMSGIGVEDIIFQDGF